MDNSIGGVDKSKRYKLALAGSNICIWDWMDISEKKQWWSPRFYELLGYDEDELQASVDTFRRLLHPEDEERVFSKLETHFNIGEPMVVEYRLQTKSGAYKWFQASGQADFDEEGNAFRIAGNIIDINEQKEAELKLEKERRLLRTIIDNIPASVYVKDLEGRKILANESEYELWGFDSEDEILGKTDADLSPAGIAAISENEDKNVLETGNPIIDKDAYTEINGEQYVLLVSKLPIKDEQGDAIGLVGISVDITDRKKMENELRERNSELQKLYDTKNKIYSVIGHDLKTPLSSIVGLTDLMLSDIEDKEELEEQLVMIKQSSLKMSDLLEDLLQWARLQTGDLSINREPFAPADVINNARDLLLRSADEKGITISLKTDRGHSVNADKQMIATIVRNLLSNAIKFSGPGDQITVEQQSDSEHWMISVSDEGVGISEKNLANLFDEEDHPTEMGTDKEKGSGIGLRLCKELAELHQGEITVKSEHGEGSTFTLKIPHDENEIATQTDRPAG